MVRTSIVPYKHRICNLVRVPVQISTTQCSTHTVPVLVLHAWFNEVQQATTSSRSLLVSDTNLQMYVFSPVYSPTQCIPTYFFSEAQLQAELKFIADVQGCPPPDPMFLWFRDNHYQYFPQTNILDGLPQRLSFGSPAKGDDIDSMLSSGCTGGLHSGQL